MLKKWNRFNGMKDLPYNLHETPNDEVPKSLMVVTRIVPRPKLILFLITKYCRSIIYLPHGFNPIVLNQDRVKGSRR
jgi:hypothetical protein